MCRSANVYARRSGMVMAIAMTETTMLLAITMEATVAHHIVDPIGTNIVR